MLNLTSLCFPDREKSCFFCCPPIRDPNADPLDDVEGRRRRFRENRARLAERVRNPEEISGESCWGLGFLDAEERQVGCLLHPLQNHGRDLRHLTGYQFKCANALCREAGVFARLTEKERAFCLALCRGMDSFSYASRTNPLMRLLAWEERMVKLVVANFPGRVERQDFVAGCGFLWEKLDFRLDGYLATEVAAQRGLGYLRRQLPAYLEMRREVIAALRHYAAGLNGADSIDRRPTHRLAIPLPLSRLLKFGADLWELPAGEAQSIKELVDTRLAAFRDCRI